MNRRNFTKGLFGLAILGVAPVAISKGIVNLATGENKPMTAADIIKEAFRILEPKLNYLNYDEVTVINEQMRAKYNAEKVGDTVRVRMPIEYKAVAHG